MMTTTGSPRTKKTRKPRKTVAVKKLPSNPFMNEILELVSEQKTDAKKGCHYLKSMNVIS